MRDQIINSATVRSKLDQIHALVDELPSEMYLWSDVHNASPNQMDQLEKLFTAIYRIRALLGSEEDSDPDVNAVMVKLPELILTKDFDAWMALFLEHASAFSSTFVGALDGLLVGCEVLSILYRSSKLCPSCIRLVKNTDAMDFFSAILTSQLEASTKSLSSTLDSTVNDANLKHNNSVIVGLEGNSSNSASGMSNVAVGNEATNNNAVSVLNTSLKLDESSVKLGDVQTNVQTTLDVSDGNELGFTVVKHRGRGASNSSGGKLPTKILAQVPVATINSFGPLADHLGEDEDQDVTAEAAAFRDLETELLKTPTAATGKVQEPGDLNMSYLSDDLSYSQPLSQDGKINTHHTPPSYDSQDVAALSAKLQLLEKQIEKLTNERISDAGEAIASYKKMMKKEFDDYIKKLKEDAVISFGRMIAERELVATRFMASVEKADEIRTQLRKDAVKGALTVQSLQHYDHRMQMSDELLKVTSEKVESMDSQLKQISDMCAKIEDKFEGYDEETTALDEKLLLLSKSAAGVSDNSHLDQFQSQLKGASLPAENPIPSAPPVDVHVTSSVDLHETGNDDSAGSILVEDATVASLDNTAIRSKKRSDFLKQSHGQVLIPTDGTDLVVMLSPRDDDLEKVYVYDIGEDLYSAKWKNSGVEAFVYPFKSWIKFDAGGSLVWGCITRYEFTLEQPIYCVQVNDSSFEIHAADVIQHAKRKPVFPNATATPSRSKPTSTSAPSSRVKSMSTPVTPMHNRPLKQTTLDECHPFHIQTDNGSNAPLHYPSTPVPSIAAAMGPPQLKSNEYIYPYDPANPRVSSVTSIKNLNTSSLQSKLVPLSDIGANSNCREFYTHIKNLLDDLNVPLRSFDDFSTIGDIDVLLECSEDTAFGFQNLRSLASKLLYQIFEAERQFLLPDDNFSLSEFGTYLDSRDGLSYFSKIIKRHHPTLSESNCKEIVYGPTFNSADMTIHDYVTELIKFRRLSPGYTEAEIVIHFLKTIDERFKDAKGSLLTLIHRLCTTTNDPVLPEDYKLNNIASTVIMRCTTDKVQQNKLSGLPSSKPNTATAYKVETDLSSFDAQINSAETQINAFKQHPSKPNNTSTYSTSTSSTKPSTKNRKELCPCCKSFCRGKCRNLGRLLALQDYMSRFRDLDWKQLLKEYKDDNIAFLNKAQRSYDKRQRVRINKFELEEQLREVNWPESFIEERVSHFVQTEKEADTELMFCSADVDLTDTEEPLISA